MVKSFRLLACRGVSRPYPVLQPLSLGFVMFATGLLLAGCGGSNNPVAIPAPVSTATPLPSPVTLTADTTEVLRGQPARLQWSVFNGATVVESNFGATESSGSISVTPLETTTYTLTVRDASGQNVSGSTTVRVAAVAISVAPAPATVDVSQSLTFTATVTGALDTRVIWSVDEAAGGTVTADGVYTAPAVAGTYHVRAQSQSDISKAAVVEVRVRAASGSVGIN